MCWQYSYYSAKVRYILLARYKVTYCNHSFYFALISTCSLLGLSSLSLGYETGGPLLPVF